MFGLLKGQVEAIYSDCAIVSCSGVGFLVYSPLRTLHSWQVGQQTTVHTHLVVREDALTLYAFHDYAELLFFKLLLGVSGLGPKLSLALLSGKDLDSLKLAIAAGDLKSLCTVNGVGKKTAERICLELKDKVGMVMQNQVGIASAQDEVSQALQALGYSASEAAQAIMRLTPNERSAELEEQISAVLRYLARS